MTAFLASVRSASEARIALDAGADIIDAKEPDAGALGAVSAAELARIVAEVNGARPVSATVGDLPMRPELIASATRERAISGANFIKIGLFDGAGAVECAQAACAIAASAKIIAVLFADMPVTQSFVQPDFVKQLASAGVSGVMLDTADKTSGGLLAHFDVVALAEFVVRTRAANLLCGLAGSLQMHDIVQLMTLRPNFLGFRSALCVSGQRGETLDMDRTSAVARTVHQDKRLQPLYNKG
ncbi:MAG: (5-formylfuran-3-yl)methyl phosphate synthase [Hyphomicrobiales bacterium]|nr:(5-formylfuran-3-yl)methyl phosphate synthase [Hyphomicrobiales bacterium]